MPRSLRSTVAARVAASAAVSTPFSRVGGPAALSVCRMVPRPVWCTCRGISTPPIRTLTRVERHMPMGEAAGFFDPSGKNQREDFDDGLDEDEVAAVAATKLPPSPVSPTAEETGTASEKVVEFTEEEAQKLDKLFQKRLATHQFLSTKERALLKNMIFNEFYRDLGRTKDDPAMHYQASLEIIWLEEWVDALMAGRWTSHEWDQVIAPRNTDEARRLIKKAVLERVDLHKPLSYIIGSQPFFGCDIACRAPLLCPRPETEMWTHWFVKEVLSRATATESPLTVLDVCCGTGCIGVAIAKHVPHAHVTALDVLPEAVETSRHNARHNGVPDARYRAILSDMFAAFNDATQQTAPPFAVAERDGLPPQATPHVAEGSGKQEEARAEGLSDAASVSRQREAGVVPGVPAFRSVVNPPTKPKVTIAQEHVGTFDAIVANPPYVLPEQYVDLPRTITHWESKTALVGDDYRETRQYLYFQELCECGLKLLKRRRERDPALQQLPNMCIEVGVQARMVASIMERSGRFEDVEVHLDFAQQERWITANSKH